jgi:hypothetical protein
MFEAFVRPGRRVSSSTICLGGRWGELPQNADGWRSLYAWKPKRGFFSSSKMGIPARRVANPHASSKLPARETATREQAAPTRNQSRGRAVRVFSVFSQLSQKISVDRTRRCSKADENYDAIAAGIRRNVDVEIWLPVVEGPNVTSLIDHYTRLTHHREEAGRLALTI